MKKERARAKRGFLSLNMTFVVSMSLPEDIRVFSPDLASGAISL
jgi:hypothetical protein